MTNTEAFLSRKELGERWNVQPKTIDRMRQRGLLPWLDLSGGKGGKTLVRFKIGDVEAYETRNRLAPFEQGVHENGAG